MERRVVRRAPLAVCSDGHAEAVGEPEEAVQIICPRCEQWTWEDGNFCIRCGVKRQAS